MSLVKGAIPVPLIIEVERELTQEDLIKLIDAPKISVPVLQKLRPIHHKQAQLLASGKNVNEVAALVGCTPARLVQLQNDPAFMDLVKIYQDQVLSLMMTDSARLADKITIVGEMAVDELSERLEDDQKRKAMPVGEIRKIAEFAMDRTVAPPKVAAPPTSAPAAITINFGTKVRTPPTLDISPESIQITEENT